MWAQLAVPITIGQAHSEFGSCPTISFGWKLREEDTLSMCALFVKWRWDEATHAHGSSQVEASRVRDNSSKRARGVTEGGGGWMHFILPRMRLELVTCMSVNLMRWRDFAEVSIMNLAMSDYGTRSLDYSYRQRLSHAHCPSDLVKSFSCQVLLRTACVLWHLDHSQKPEGVCPGQWLLARCLVLIILPVLSTSP